MSATPTPDLPLGIWTDGTDWYIARTAEDASAMRAELIGAEEEAENVEMNPWRALAPDEPLPIRDEDRGTKTTKTVAEWIASEPPGFLCSTEF